MLNAIDSEIIFLKKTLLIIIVIVYGINIVCEKQPYIKRQFTCELWLNLYFLLKNHSEPYGQ